MGRRAAWLAYRMLRDDLRTSRSHDRHSWWRTGSDLPAPRSRMRSKRMLSPCAVGPLLGPQRHGAQRWPENEQVARQLHHRCRRPGEARSEEHTSELQSLMRNSYAVFCLKKKTKNTSK